MKNAAEFVAHAFVQAIGRQDVAGLVALMTEGHRFVDSLGTAVEGREAMREAWTRYFSMVPDYSIEVESTLSDGPVVVLFGMARGTYAPDGTLRAENRWETPAALRAVIENGKVAEWRVYADNEPIRRVIAKAGFSKSIPE